MLRCGPRQDVNMRTLALARAEELAAARRAHQTPADILNAARSLIQPSRQLDNSIQFPASWASRASGNPALPGLDARLAAGPPGAEPGIELPATLLLPRETAGVRAAAILHFDDAGRNRLLYRNGLLARAAGFLEREGPHAAVLTVDLRGWGDSDPAVYPYEMAGWGGVDRYLAYATAALGDPVLAMRVRDGLAALAYLRSRPDIDPARIVVTGCGLGGVVALLVAAADGSTAGLVTWDALVSFHSLLRTADYRWPADAFLPNALLYCDLPELVAALPCPAAVLNPRDGAGVAVDAEGLDALNVAHSSVVYCRADDGDIARALQELVLA
jgi:dienelactone hydrolase